ncbi:MAG: asparagine synthase (glutamine-hydrolyzing) [Chitinophagaceae bacterium]
MCGICGFMRINDRVSEKDFVTIEKMNKKLIHRGPDAQASLLLENVALGFSRLSIIGLDNGMQPIRNEDGSVVLICNGEIFNYIELRSALVKKGHTFNTTTDVEVIVHLYEDHGMEFLNELNGQFAFVLYDEKKKTLFCARDQMGIIPLFYTRVDNNFIFASEIKAILEYPGVIPEVDLVGLDQVLTFPGLISPRTMFRNIWSIENGHFLTIDREGKLIDKEYWDLVYPEGEMLMNGKSEEYYVDQLEELLESSIKLRMRADVPTGFYLSGGLDSSMILMKADQLFSGVSKQVFSIDFADSHLSESTFQRQVASQSNSILNQKIFFYDDISERLKASVYHGECPVKETYNTASLSLSESVRSSGIKVIQSGEGADEFFAGYVGYRFDKMRSMNKVSNYTSPREKELRKKIWGDEHFLYERNFLEFDKVKQALYSADVNAGYNEVNCLNHYIINKDRLANRSPMSKRAYVDYKLRLVDHLVSDHGDRMSLANSVEVRYPFMDKNIVEYSAKLPADLKLNGLTEKYILKKMAKRFIPKEVVDREKFHFVAPGSPYLLQKNIEYINDLLSYETIKKQGFFNPDHIEKLKKEYRQEGFSINAPFESDLLITVISFGLLLEIFFD